MDTARRKFLRTTGVLGTGLIIAPAIGCVRPNKGTVATYPTPDKPAVPPSFVLPELGYAFTALEPAIDALTMEIHHGKHHAAYVNNLNKALAESADLAGASLEELCARVTDKQAAIRNNGGGHYNHSRFWKWISPGGAKAPTGELASAITADLGGYDAFVKAFGDAAKSRFGSGWAWLSVGADKKLFVSSTPNQDNPLMVNLVKETGKPILGIDVWEHAYYLHYQNRRPDYVSAFMGIINWDVVAQDYAAAMAS